MELDPAPAVSIVQHLLSLGGTAAVLWVALYYVLKTLKEQYDKRLVSLEQRSDKCEDDRKLLHQQVHKMQAERIDLLERLLESRPPAPSRSAPPKEEKR